jgi:hypothetical protein
MKPLSASIALFLTLLLAACGGGNSEGGGEPPPPPQDTPTLSSISPTSAVVESSAVNLALFGSNFENGATVDWNGSPLSSSWVSASQITATIPATDIASIGSAKVTVINPGATGGTSAPQTFSIIAAPPSTTFVKAVAGTATAQNIVWDAADGMLYVSLPSTDPSAPNSIVPINPISGAAGAPVAAGHNPNLLSISPDSSYLWVGLDGDNAVQRFLLPGLTKDVSFAVPSDSGGNAQQAVGLQAARVSAHAVALIAGHVQTDPAGNGVYVYDDATQRAAFVPGRDTGGPTIVSVQWGADDSTIYGVESGIATLDVSSSGVSLATVNGGTIVPQAQPQYDATNGLLYSTGSSFAGATLNPVNGSLVGGFDTPGGSETCTADFILARYYCVSGFNTGGGDVENVELWVFDLNSYALLDRVLFGFTAGKPISPITGNPVELVRWGNAGLAVITNTADILGNGGLFLIDGAAVNPKAAPDFTSGATTWAYGEMSSLAPEQAAAGSGAAAVTVNGENFTPTSTACWNCNFLQEQFLPTTYVNSTQLTITIPANLLANAGTLPISIFDSASDLFSTNALTFSAMPASGNTKVSALDLAGLAMAWNASSSLLYVATADYDGEYPNSIVAINAETGSVMNSQTVSPDPDSISISSDDQYLYAGFDAATELTQLQLPALGSPLTWPLTNPLSSATFWAGDLRAAPVSPHTTAITLFNQLTDPEETGGVVIYDDSALRPNYVNGWGGGPAPPAIYDTLAWGPTDQLLTGACSFGCISNTPLSPLYVFQIGASGAAFVAANPPSFSQGEIHSDFGTGLIYSDDGSVANPATQAIVGSYNASGLVAPDSSLNSVFILGQTSAQANTNNFTIESFNESTFAAVSSITLNNVLGTPLELIRWGTSGLAILTVNPIDVFSGNTGSLGMLYLIEDTNFVSSADVVAVPLAKPEERVQRRWKSFSKAEFVKMVQARRLRIRP